MGRARNRRERDMPQMMETCDGRDTREIDSAIADIEYQLAVLALAEARLRNELITLWAKKELAVLDGGAQIHR